MSGAVAPYVRTNVVDRLWREGWFIKTAKGISRSVPTLSAEDMAAESVFTAMRAAESWREDGVHPVDSWVKFRARNEMLRLWRKHLNERARFADVDLTSPVIDGGNPLIDMICQARSAEDQARVLDWQSVARDVHKALDTLTVNQRSVAVSRMHARTQRAPGHVAAQGNWHGARSKLRNRLQHLRWMVVPA